LMESPGLREEMKQKWANERKLKVEFMKEQNKEFINHTANNMNLDLKQKTMLNMQSIAKRQNGVTNIFDKMKKAIEDANIVLTPEERAVFRSANINRNFVGGFIDPSAFLGLKGQKDEIKVSTPKAIEAPKIEAIEAQKVAEISAKEQIEPEPEVIVIEKEINQFGNLTKNDIKKIIFSIFNGGEVAVGDFVESNVAVASRLEKTEQGKTMQNTHVSYVKGLLKDKGILESQKGKGDRALKMLDETFIAMGFKDETITDIQSQINLTIFDNEEFVEYKSSTDDIRWGKIIDKDSQKAVDFLVVDLRGDSPVGLYRGDSVSKAEEVFLGAFNQHHLYYSLECK